MDQGRDLGRLVRSGIPDHERREIAGAAPHGSGVESRKTTARRSDYGRRACAGEM